MLIGILCKQPCWPFPQRHPINTAGEVLEQAVFLSIQMQDDRAFERNYDQLKTYYTDTGCVYSSQPYLIANARPWTEGVLRWPRSTYF